MLAAIRQLCLENLPGYDEGMDYGMPSYAKDGVVEFGFASQKNYISHLRAEIGRARVAPRRVRRSQHRQGLYPVHEPEEGQSRGVERLLKATAASNGRVC